jgi:hypothetical protein
LNTLSLEKTTCLPVRIAQLRLPVIEGGQVALMRAAARVPGGAGDAKGCSATSLSEGGMP